MGGHEHITLKKKKNNNNNVVSVPCTRAALSELRLLYSGNDQSRGAWSLIIFTAAEDQLCQDQLMMETWLMGQ